MFNNSSLHNSTITAVVTMTRDLVVLALEGQDVWGFEVVFDYVVYLCFFVVVVVVVVVLLLLLVVVVRCGGGGVFFFFQSK